MVVPKGGSATSKLFMDVAYSTLVIDHQSEETRNVVSTAAFNVFRGLAASGFSAMFSAYMSRLGYSLGEIGVAVTLSNVLGALFSPAVGYMLEVYSSRVITAITGLMISAALALVAFSESMAALALGYSLFHLSIHFAQPARMVFLARVVDRGRLGTVVGLTTSVFTAARAVGPALSGFMVASYGYPETFLALAAVSAAGSLVFLALSTEPGGVEKPSRTSFADSFRRVFSPDRRLGLLYLFASLDRAAWYLWYPMLSAHLLSRGYDEVGVGALISLSNVIEAVGTPLAGKLVDRVGSSSALVLSEAAAALAAVLLALPAALHSAAAMLFIGISISFWIPSYNVYVVKVFKNVGEVFASVNAVRSVTSIPAPYLGGFLYGSLSPLAPFALSASMLLAATAIASTSLKSYEFPEGREQLAGVR